MQRIVFVHGSVGNGDSSWAKQRLLADQFELLILNRPGFPPGPVVDEIDFEEHAKWVANQLRAGDHLCGHSYGGIVSLFAAAASPNLASLTIVEPPAFGLAAGHEAVDIFVSQLKKIWDKTPRDPFVFLSAFYAAVLGRPVALPNPLPPELEQGARALMVERFPWTAKPPLEVISAAGYPKLVISGGWHPAFDAVCDVLENRLNAQRAVVAGMGHNPQLLGEPFNQVIKSFISGHSENLN